MMHLNNKGFAISSVLYLALILFLILIVALLAMMGSRKNILDKMRNDAYNNINDKIKNSNSNLRIVVNNMSRAFV